MNDDLLYRLMPALYRQRDTAQDLRRYMSVLGSQFSLLRADIEALLDNWFIETCDDWVVPYLGELVEAGHVQRGRHMLPGHRVLVANTLAYRSGKGSLGVLERAAADISGWAVRAAEGSDALALTQSLQWPRPGHRGSADLRHGRRCAPRSVETRLPRMDDSAGNAGRYNLHGVALEVCRLTSYPVRNAEARALGDGRYTFHPLGRDQPLFDTPARQPLALAMDALRDDPVRALRVTRAGAETFAAAALTVADLSHWALPPGAAIAVDPLRGRILLAEDWPAGLRVSYQYGMSADLGGGPYPRASVAASGAAPAWSGTLCRAAADPGAMNAFTGLEAALAGWRGHAGHGVLRILDSSTYRWPRELALADGAVLTIEAASGVTPAILGDLRLATGDGGGTLALGGLRCAGALRVAGSPVLRLHHCTWLPGGAASVEAFGAARIEMEHCISGPVHMAGGDLALSGCIVDGGAAIVGDATLQLSLKRCTVLGDVSAGRVGASESLVTGTIQASGADAPRLRFCHAGGTPAFTSLRYGQPGYCQLGAGNQALCRGAEDGAEIGVFHDLYQPQRAAALRDVVAEYLPMSLHAGVYYLN